MSIHTHTEVGGGHLSPGLIALLGFLLMLAAFVVDVTTDPAAAHATEPAAAEEATG